MRVLRGQFQTLFRTQQGHKFYGELGIPALTASTTDFQPRRTLIVSKKAMVDTGDVAFSDSGTFLLAHNATFEETLQFKCFEITHRTSWSRMVNRIDPVTGMARDDYNQILDPALPVVIEYGTIVQNIRIETERYNILTGADVQVGDRLGAWIVQTRREALGLNLLQVS